MLNFASESGEPDASGCYLDLVSGKITSVDGLQTLEVAPPLLEDLVAVGILSRNETEFFDESYTVNLAAVSATSSWNTSSGSTNPIEHIVGGEVQGQCKLTVIMYLAADGWLPHEPDVESESYYGEGLAKRFELLHTRPKSYFVALAKAPAIFQKLNGLESVPCIHHGMSDSYYKALLTLTTAADLAKLDSILAAAADIYALADKTFGDLLKADQGDEDEPLALEDGRAEEDLDPDVVLAALMGGDSDIDRQSMHRNALAVIRGLPAASVDLRTAKSSVRGGHRLVVHFDIFRIAQGNSGATCRAPVLIMLPV